MFLETAIKRHWLRRYAFAVVFFGLTIGLSLLLTRLGLKLNLTIPIVFALVATAWYGGRGPGFLIAVLFQATTIIYTPIPPDSSVPKAIFGYFSVFSLYLFLVLLLTSLKKTRDELRIRERQQAAIASFGQIALSGIPLDELLPQATDLCREVLQVDFTAVCKKRSETNKLYFSAASGWDEDIKGFEFEYDSSRSLARHVLESERAIIVEDLIEDSSFETSPILTHHEVRSGICVRIAHREDSIGVFGAFQVRRRKFSEDDVHFLQSMANIIAEASSRLGTEDDLRNQRSWLHTTLTSIGDGVIATDCDGIVTFMNPVAEELTGWEESSGCGRSLRDVFRVFDESTGAELADPVDQVLKTGCVVELASHTILRSKNGDEIPVDYSAAAIKDGDETTGVVLVFSDVSERKRSEASAAALASIVASTSDAIIGKDLEGTIGSWNKGAERIFGYTSQEVIGQSVTILMPHDRVNEEPTILERIRNGETIDHYETVRRRKDGKLIDISLTVSPVFDARGHIVGASKIARDITEQRVASRAIRQRETMNRIVDAQESERRRIARDIHDHLGQQITAHRLKMEALTHKCAANPALAKSARELQSSASYIDRGLNFLSWELRPTELEKLGLIDALKSFVREWGVYHHIGAEFQVTAADSSQPPVRFSEQVETNLYRIAQEALHNILQHAEAYNVSVLLQTNDGYLNLIIEDDGHGFSLQEAPVEVSPVVTGLIGMRERAKLLDGTFEIDSVPGRGTSIYVRIPMKNNPSVSFSSNN